jgi:Tol biopolymer transport system component/DNA-binding winged helix-turn-helix (wHTH) protein
MNLPGARNLTIGPWLIEPSLLRATRGAESVRLEPKTLQVLLRLAETPGEVVAKERLHREVWNGEYAAEDGLRRAILHLRRLFGDEAKSPTFIETVPRLGYRLLVEPRAVAKESAPLPAEEQSRRRVGRGLGGRSGLVLAVAAVLALVWLTTRGEGLWPTSRPTKGPLAGSLEVVPLTTYPGLESSPSFSPDGTRVAFVWEREGEPSHIYVKMVEGETPVQLTASPAPDGEPAWSPDGRWVAFVRRKRTASEVWLVPPLGGGERLLASLAPAPIRGLSWTPDSASIIYAYGPAEGAPSSLYRLAVADLEISPVSEPPRGTDGDRYPEVSPDGSRIAFVRSAVHGLDDIYLADLRSTGRPAPSGEPRRLTRLQRKVTDLAWQPDGRSLLTAQLHDFRYGLWRVSIEDGEACEIALGEDDAFQVAVTSAGDRLAFSRERFDSDIWSYPLAAPGGAGRPLIDSTHVDYGPAVSPVDGRLVFLSKRSGAAEVWVSAPDGSEPRRLTDFAGPYVGHARWSPVGASIAFDARANGNADIYEVTTAGESPRRLTTDPAEDVAPNWSLDGSRVYFASNRGGDWQVWRVAVGGGEPEQVTHDGGFFAAESLDGRWIHYTRMHLPGLYRMPVEGGAEELFLSQLAGGAWANWAETRDGFLLLTAGASEGWDVARVRGPAAEAELVLHLDQWPPNPGLAVAADALLLTRYDDIEGDLMLARPSGARRQASPLAPAGALSSAG